MIVDDVKDWNRDYIRSLLHVGRGEIQTNQLLNIFFSNWIYLSQEHSNQLNYRFIPTSIFHTKNCSCATSSTCIEFVYVNESILPGFVLDCNPIESLLRSTLICLYNETYIQSINFNNLSFVKSLNTSISSQYLINSTVDELISNAFIEEWLLNISYSQFFSTCAPSICTYSISTRKNFLEVTTILLGLYGGLIFLLRVIVPRLMIFLDEDLILRKRHNERVVPLS